MATIIPVENYWEIEQRERERERQLKCNRLQDILCKISLWSILYIVLLSIIALGSVYLYIGDHIIPNNQNPSSDTKYYQYYNILYNYSAYYSNYTLNTNNINNYDANYYFTITDDTNREKNDILCDHDSTPNINVANIYLPNKYKPYQKVVLYYINDNNKCTLILPAKSTTIYNPLSVIFLVFAIFLLIIIPIFKGMYYCN
jgi:hypothetical protein